MTSLMTLNQHDNYIIIASLKSETMGKLISRIPGECLLISSLPGECLLISSLPGECLLISSLPGECLLISSLPGSALRTHVELLGKPRYVNKC